MMKNLQAFIKGLFIILIIGSATANAATWTVTKAENGNDNVCDADCSLREAVFNADSLDTIVFDSDLVGQTITLGGSEIVITKRITIDGFLNDPNVAFISGEMTSRLFSVETGGGLNLRNAILVQGNGASATINSGYGGAIFAGTNTAVSLDRVAVRGNRAQYGGALYIENGGTHRITNSSLTGNSAEQGTAILGFTTTIFMSNTTVSGNYLSLDEPQTVGGGAITTRRSAVTIRNSTIVNNSAKRGGGICVINTGYPTPENKYNIGNTIIAGNTATISGQDINYTSPEDFELISAGGNLVQDLETVPANIFNQPNDIFGVNPLLGPINANLGGHPVLYHPLQAGSPARNGGINANAIDPLTNQPLTFDARGAGFPRIADATVDKGAFEDQSGNTSLIVTKKADTNDLVCDTDCSLREAVHQASLNFGTDTITFAPNVFGTITLGGSEILIKNQSVNIVGYTKANVLTVSGNNASRIFKLENSTAGISGMTLTGGKAEFVPNSNGGAIYGDASNLSLDRVIITGNEANAYGAFYLQDGSTQRITNSTVSGNTAKTCVGIGVRSTTIYMANTTVSGNSISGGGAGNGAVCGALSTINIRNSTVAFNRASKGGGINLSGSELNIGNSIVAQNIAPTNPDIELQTGSITSAGGNLVQNTNGFPAGTFSQTNDATGVDPLLNALADNGGNVPTHALMPNSPAGNSGINASAIDPFDDSPLITDARGTGFTRIQNSLVDKGAFEMLAPTAAAVSISGLVTDGKNGLARANVLLTFPNGEIRTVRTSSFGYFKFDNVPAGAIYIVDVYSKGQNFSPQIISVHENVSDLFFTPME